MPDKSVRLRWTEEELRFRGESGEAPAIPLDGDGESGPSPTDALLMSLGGCMGIDVVMILGKMRVPLESLEVEVEGDRAGDAPRRFTAIRATFRVEGVPDEAVEKLERAVSLSEERYCSVLHSLREDLAFSTEIVRA